MNRKNDTPGTHTTGMSQGEIYKRLSEILLSDSARDIGVLVLERIESIETAGVTKIRPNLTPVALYLGSVRNRCFYRSIARWSRCSMANKKFIEPKNVKVRYSQEHGRQDDADYGCKMQSLGSL